MIEIYLLIFYLYNGMTHRDSMFTTLRIPMGMQSSVARQASQTHITHLIYSVL